MATEADEDRPERPQRLRRLLEALGPALRREMRPVFGTGRADTGSCVAAVRIGLDALARLGVADAAPLRVNVVIMNRACAAQLKRYGRLPLSVEEREAWFRDTGAHSIGLGFPVGASAPRHHRDAARVDPTGLHVAAAVERAWLWDPSLDQVNRPEHGLVLKPLVAPAPFWFLVGTDPLVHTNPAGAVVHYEVRGGAADNRSYEASPNWGARDAAKRAAVVARALADPAVREAAGRLAESG